MPQVLLTFIASSLGRVDSLAALSAAGSTSTTVKGATTTNSSASLFYLVILGLMVVFYFLFLRPRRQQMRAQQVEARNVSYGDDVVTAGGIVGRVVGLDDVHVQVEVADGVVMTFVRRSVNRAGGAPAPGSRSSGGARGSISSRTEPVEPDPIVDSGEWDAHGTYEADEHGGEPDATDGNHGHP